MKWTRIEERPATYALIFDAGDDPKAELEAFAREHGLSAAHFSGLGAFEEVVLGYFAWERRDYLEIPVREQVEVLSLLGDVALKDGAPEVHAHVVVGKRDGTAHGGHLLRGRVRPTLEVVLVESPAYLRRVMDVRSGLPLIKVDA
jgi:uncharacterized protein